MAQFGINPHRFWRQIASCVAVYALVLQGLFAGLVGPQVAAFAASGDELCLHSTYDGAPAPTDVPGDHADQGVHCPFCLIGGHQAATPPLPSAPRFVAPAAAQVYWPADQSGNSSPADYLSNPPRGPPVTA